MRWQHAGIAADAGKRSRARKEPLSGYGRARTALGATAGRLAHHQLGLEQDFLRRNRFAGFDQLERELAGFLTDGHGLLVDAGERNLQEFVVEQIAAADDRYVVGDG